MRAPARGDPERTAAAEIFCSGPEPGFKPTGASPGFVGTASAGLPPPASSLLPQLRRAGVERIDPVARDCLQAGLSADELGELVDTYLANLALRKFDGPGALVDRIRNGTWPVPGVVDAAELQRQRRERNQRLQHAQRQTAIRYEFARVRKRLHQPGHYLHQYDAAAIAELQRDHGYTEAEIEEALA